MKTTQLLILEDNMLMLLHGNLKRVFALKVSPTSLREVHNILVACCKDHNQASMLLETLLSGNTSEVDPSQKAAFEDLCREFTIPLRVAKEVAERGDFLNLITSDTLFQGERFAFINRLKRIDGEEFSFMTDLEHALHIVHHLATRWNDLTQHESGQAALKQAQPSIAAIIEKLKALV